MANAVEYIEAILAREEFRRQITGHRVMEEARAKVAEPARPYPEAIREVLDQLGIASLYSHQVEAMYFIRSGQDVVVTTPTASGKTLIYNLPFLERRLQDPDATALYLFPLKALAQDQKKTFESLTQGWPAHARPPIALYDGDTPQVQRNAIRKNPPAVLVTNPEMLHLGILPWHERWTTFLASLSMVVLDEAHIYRGVFGAHMANVLRRLERVCRRYNANPVHVLCTATVGNPGQLGQLLLGCEHEPKVVDKSGAPRGRRHMLFMEPETSASTLAIGLLQQALKRRLRTIVYCRSRRMTELLSLWASQQARDVARRISAYRAGYLPEERREIEAKMASGELLAVVSTSALELGIDIGSLDVCILVGYPGSVMQTLQRGGRVGRKGQESCVLLVGGEDALDQYFVRNPDEFFSRPPENAMLNPDNPVILARHLECAAAETPLRIEEPWLSAPSTMEVARELEAEGVLLRSAAGRELLCARKKPQRDVSLRGSGQSFQIVDEKGTVIGSVDAHQAFRETHEGAVYLHHGRSYTIRKLDLGSHTAHAAPARVSWHTNVRTQKTTEIMDVRMKGQVFGMEICLGRLKVTELITGYERRENASRRLLDIQPLELPPQTFETEGLWMCIPDAARVKVEDNYYHFMGSIHALEHVSIGLMPLLVMADRNDFGGISTPMHAQVGGPAVFVYDGLPGGAGLTASAYPRLDELLKGVRLTLVQCPCETGCPSCIQSPKCGSGNRPLDKAGALLLVDTLLSGEHPGLSYERIEKRPKGATLPGEGGLEEDLDVELEGGFEMELPGDAAEGAGAGQDDAALGPVSKAVDQEQDASFGKRDMLQEIGGNAKDLGEQARNADRDKKFPAGQRASYRADSAPSSGKRRKTEGVVKSPLDEGERRTDFSRTGEGQEQGIAARAFPSRLESGSAPDADPELLAELARMGKMGQDEELARAFAEDDAGAAARDAPAGAAQPASSRKEKTKSMKKVEKRATVQPSLLGMLGGAAGTKDRDEASRTSALSPDNGRAKGGASSLIDLVGQSAGAPESVEAAEPVYEPEPLKPRQKKVYPGPVMVFDVETRRSAKEVGGWNYADRMGVSVCVCWDGEKYRSYAQEELGEMFALWKTAGLIVGFNSSRFDMRVLQPFCPYFLSDLPHLDLLRDIYDYLHYRVSLDNVGKATLGIGKSGDGLDALEWWKEGSVDLIREYCRMDVEITRKVFEYGQEKGYILFANKAGQKVRVPVDW